MIHPPKQDESQITHQGNPNDSGFESVALSGHYSTLAALRQSGHTGRLRKNHDSRKRISLAFTALSHARRARRARIFRLLAENPEAGRTFNGLQQATGYKEAPLLHHLQVMERAGLIRKQRIGATVARIITPGPLTDAIEEATRLATSARRKKLKAV